jgi:hypothetical protein
MAETSAIDRPSTVTARMPGLSRFPPQLRQGLIDEINPEQDSLRFYFLGKNWRNRVEQVGAKQSYDPEGPLIA